MADKGYDYEWRDGEGNWTRIFARDGHAIATVYPDGDIIFTARVISKEEVRHMLADIDSGQYLKSGKDENCARCGSDLNNGLCSDETCPFSDTDQDDERGWAGHPEMDKNLLE